MDNSKKGVISRIQEFRKQNDITIQKLSDDLSFPRGTLEKYLNGPKYPSVEFLLSFRSKYGVSLHWLMEGVGPTFLSDEQVNLGDYVPTPNQVLGAGIQATIGEDAIVGTEDETGHHEFERAWIERSGLTSSGPSVSVISVSGNSMEPDLYDGDLVLLDHSSTNLDEVNIFAVRFSDALHLKRIQHRPGGKVLLVSKNKSYPDIEIAYPVTDDVEIVGRVVSSMHEW
jgi:transcriptional regulator with XRE-family HTH domain